MDGRDNRGRRRPFRKDGRGNDPSKQDRREHGSPRLQNGRDKADSRHTPPDSGKAEFPFRPRKRNDRHGFDKNGIRVERSNWIPPKQSSEPMPELTCVRCGLPIDDSNNALTDRNSGSPVHFACVLSELSEKETLEEGDVVSYIGGGRFGIVHFGERGEAKKFTIKKIVEWEDKEKRAEWRGVIADHYSIT